MTHKIVFLDRDTIAPHIKIRRPVFAHEWTEHDRTKAEVVAVRLAGATIAITNKAPIRVETLDKCPNLNKNRLTLVLPEGCQQSESS